MVRFWRPSCFMDVGSKHRQESWPSQIAAMSTYGQQRGPLGTLAYNNQRCHDIGTNWSGRLMRNKFQLAPTLYRKDFKGHFGCVNAIEFSNQGGEVIASGGDDRRVLLWNVEEGISSCAKPVAMKGEHHSNIFCLAFDNCNAKIFSGGNDEQVIVHDLKTGATLDVFNHDDAVYGLSVDPLNDNVFASACDDGRILIYDIRAPPSEDPFCLANYAAQFHAVVYNPVEPRLLATANSTQGIGLWDVRKPRSCLLRYGGSLMEQSCMSVRINRSGDRLIALRRRLPPVLYNIDSALPVYQFDHAGYYNSCTMKSCCFAGDEDQYIISGSDDFNLYVWRIPDEPGEVPWVGEAHLVLRGHRSIVNQVRFNPANHLVVSSGVEKVIKMWSPFEMPDSTMAPYISPPSQAEPVTTVADTAPVEATLEERPVYTQEEYYNLLLRSGQVMSHDYSHQSLDEDPRMMAFFDALVQRELEGFSSDDDSLDSSPRIMLQFVQPSDSEVSIGGEQILSDNSPALSPPVIESPGSTIRVATLTGQVPLEAAENIIEGGGNQGLLNIDDTATTGHRAAQRLTGSATPSVASAATSTNTLPGQRLLSTRPSISELITLKRKEYLSNARKFDQRISRKKKKASSSQAAKRHLVTLTTESSSVTSSTSTSSSSSSSSSSESDSSSDSSISKGPQKTYHKKARKRPRHASSSSSNDCSEEQLQGMAASAVAELRNKVTTSKRLGFQRLKQIRTNSLLNNNNNTDTNSDEGTRNRNTSGRLLKKKSRVHNANGDTPSRIDVGVTIQTYDGLLQPCSPSSTFNSSEHHNGGQQSTSNGASSSQPLLSTHENNEGLLSIRNSNHDCKDHSHASPCTNCDTHPCVSTTSSLEEPSSSGVNSCFKFKRLAGKASSQRRYRRRVSPDQSSADEGS